MPCYYPLEAYRSRKRSPSGKYPVIFDRSMGTGQPIQLPCGRCIGCRLEYSRQWAVRCVHEASLHDRNCFITLTYDEENLPSGGTLVKRHFQDFIRELRRVTGEKIRYFHCGEYGEERRRPHYHACLFGYDPPDRVALAQSECGEYCYFSSEVIRSIWKKGIVQVGDVTFESAAYVARYIAKKVTGEKARDHYSTVDVVTGEVSCIVPEYITMSRRPGIAADWYARYSADCFPSDFVTVRGRKIKPPKFYAKQLEKQNPALLKGVKTKRRLLANRHKEDNTPDRLAVREYVKKAQIKNLKRRYESGESDYD